RRAGDVHGPARPGLGVAPAQPGSRHRGRQPPRAAGRQRGRIGREARRRHAGVDRPGVGPGGAPGRLRLARRRLTPDGTATISVTNWEERQDAFRRRLGPRGTTHLETGTVVVLNSFSFAPSELRKITGVLHYEERLLFMLLYLRATDLRLVYV